MLDFASAKTFAATSSRSSLTRWPSAEVTERPRRVDPEPLAGSLEPRTAADPAYALCIIAGIVVAVLDHRPALRGPRRSAAARSPTSRSGRCRSGSPAAGSTTWPPAGSPTSARAATRWTRSRSGRAGSASGAPSPSGARRLHRLPPAGHRAAAVRRRARRPGSRSRRRIGRWGNYFNQELFGKPTKLPWGLEIDLAHRPKGYEQFTTFQPTFLYESLWCLVIAVASWSGSTGATGSGTRGSSSSTARSTPSGRFWFELLRIDDANHILGLRVNTWVSSLVFIAAVVAFVVSRRRHPGREAPDELCVPGAPESRAQLGDGVSATRGSPASPLEPTRKSRSAPVSACCTWST